MISFWKPIKEVIKEPLRQLSALARLLCILGMGKLLRRSPLIDTSLYRSSHRNEQSRIVKRDLNDKKALCKAFNVRMVACTGQTRARHRWQETISRIRDGKSEELCQRRTV